MIVIDTSSSGLASGRENSRVPWKQIAENNAFFFDPVHLPPGVKLLDPSSMSKAGIRKLLDWWRARQATESGLHTFRFQKCCTKASLDEVEEALYLRGTQQAAASALQPAGNVRNQGPPLEHGNGAINWNMDYEVQRSPAACGLQLAGPGDIFAGGISTPDVGPADLDFPLSSGFALPALHPEMPSDPAMFMGDNENCQSFQGSIEPWLHPELLDQFLTDNPDLHSEVGLRGFNHFPHPPPGVSYSPLPANTAPQAISSHIPQDIATPAPSLSNSPTPQGNSDPANTAVKHHKSARGSLPVPAPPQKSAARGPQRVSRARPVAGSSRIPADITSLPVSAPPQGSAVRRTQRVSRAQPVAGCSAIPADIAPNENHPAGNVATRARVAKRQFEFGPEDGPRPARKKGKKKQ